MAAIANVLTEVLTKVRSCPQITAQNAYVRAVREWCRQTQWYAVNVSATLATDLDIYDVNQLGDLEALNVESVSLQQFPLDTGIVPIALTRTDPSMIVPNTTASTPYRFAYLPEGAIQFFPVPDKDYPVTVRIICQPTYGAVSVPDELLVKWRTAFDAGALAYLFGLLGEPWGDANQEMLYRREFAARVNDGKADKQRGYVVGSVRATPRPFVTRGFGFSFRGR